MFPVCCVFYSPSLSSFFTMKQMNQETYQKAVDKMGETYFNRLSVLVDENRIADSDAVYSEWVVDGQDPEDGAYEFTFIPCLSE